jgi:hypothetical protein
LQAALPLLTCGSGIVVRVYNSDVPAVREPLTADEHFR